MTDSLTSKLSRRRVLQAAAAGVVGLDPALRAAVWAQGSDKHEKEEVKIGFIPLTDCASVVMASVLGIDRKYGVKIVGLSASIGVATNGRVTPFGRPVVPDEYSMSVPARRSSSSGVAGWVANNLEPLTLNGEVTDSRFSPLHPRPEIKWAVSLPMMLDGMASTAQMTLTVIGSSSAEPPLRATTKVQNATIQVLSA